MEAAEGVDVVVIEAQEANALLRRTLVASKDVPLPEVEEGERAEFEVQPGLGTSVHGRCTAALTCLVVPFTFLEGDGTPVSVCESLSRRTINDAPLWERSCIPPEAREFTSHFQKLLGFESEEGTRRLRLTEVALETLFDGARLWAFTADKKLAGKRCKWTDVSLLVCANGAVLSVTVDWLMGDSGVDRFTLADLRTWVYISKFRNNKAGVTRGWTFDGSKVAMSDDRDTVGPDLSGAGAGDDAVSFGIVANWLVKRNRDDAACISDFSYNFHHTCASLARPMAEEHDQERLFYEICHQEGARTRTKNVKFDAVRDKVLRLRENRVVFLSSGGIFGVEWEGSNNAFVNLFMKQFKVLAVHVLAEQQVLGALSLLSAESAQKLPPLGSIQTIGEKAQVRRKLLDLATMLMRYVMSLSSDHCGGRLSLQLFFTAFRDLMRVRELKEELREEVKDTLRIVESDYLEERRLLQRRGRLRQDRRDLMEKDKERREAKQRDVLQIILSLAGAVLLPFTVVSGIFGMNNADIPAQASWGWLIGGTGMFSAAVFVVLVVVYRCTRPGIREPAAYLPSDELNVEELDEFLDNL